MSGPPHKIVALGLEELVVALRAGSSKKPPASLEQIVVGCNQDLARRNVEQTVSKSTVKRYLASLDKVTVPAAHAPQAAEANAMVAIAFAERLNTLDRLLGDWLEEATDAQKVTVVGSGESAEAVYTPDWQARTGIAREMRQHLEAYANIMQRIHDAEEVKAFQQSVMDAIREASPEVAAAVITKLRERQTIIKAALLGAG